ncbi:MAG TPA: hypothetical protein PLC47_12235, partial [Bacteroidales bacterium]|nr:hypothetical protein [Bacteroidales bacterium]
MSKLLCSIFFLFVVPFWITSLLGQQLVNDFEEDKPTDNWFNVHIVSDSTAYSGKSYALIHPSQQFGPGFTLNFRSDTPFPGTLFHFSAQIRMEDPEKKAFFVMSFLDSNNKQQYWHAIDLKSTSHIKDHWYLVSDSVAIPADILQQTYLKAYFWNPESTTIAVDQLIFSQQKLLLPDYQPQSVQSTKPIGWPKVLSQNRFYELLYFKENQSFALADNRGRLLTNGWLTLTQITVKNQKQTQQN